ncbi:4-(cytidine 5'-diphospho)-2-C-methyl-D-erythritol kinase [Fibrobacter sp.]|uniref:4-(cytidine 5'-diphospho)-2-C-methyl-D-erythritol kinase n=1 Tax=Fibrobacter sp. TaxID=35828 RepID=UPI0038900C8A
MSEEKVLKEYAPAKINLFLDVIRKREDGYHDLGTVFQTVDAGDTVTATLRTDGIITLGYNNPQEYPVESDLVYKAAVALKEFAMDAAVGEVKTRAENLGADLYLEKVMPLGAGLGGGSADAAATLRVLSRLWDLNFDAHDLELIGAKLGADVPFLVRGGTAFAEGIGERLKFVDPLDLPEGQVLLIATPLDAVPTKDAYAGVPKSGPDRWEEYKAKVASSVSDGTLVSRLSSFVSFNAFETSVFPKHPLVAQMKDKFLELGAKCALMSGSGASVFGIFESREQAEAAANAMKSISRYRTITGFWHK